MSLFHFELETGQEGFYSITSKVYESLKKSGIVNGSCIVSCPHTTAGITINENADPDVVTDMLLGLRRAFPDRSEFLHTEGNSSAHLKASCIGSSVSIIISAGELLLGRWQGIWFCEFDGPRIRHFSVQIIGS